MSGHETALRELPLIGRGHARYDGRAKVTGRAQFAADVVVADPIHAFLLLSTIPRGRIDRIKTDRALVLPGVIDILTHENAPALAAPVSQAAGSATNHQPLIDPDIVFDGQVIGVVLAENFETAREAAALVDIHYVKQPAAVTLDSPGAVTERWSEINQNFEDLEVGDAEKALAEAPVTIDATYHMQSQVHNAMEPFPTTVLWDGDDLIVHEPSQYVVGLQRGVARQLGIDPSRVRIISPYIGGGFGSKLSLTPRTAILAALARKHRRPVKLVATRSQGFTLSTYRGESRHRIRLGATPDGKLTAFAHEAWEMCSRFGAYASASTDLTADMYAAPSILTRVNIVRTDRTTPGFMRGPGEMPYMFALETAMDELAYRLEMDPVELRRLNEPARSPIDGSRFTSRSLVKCFDEAAERFGWRNRNPVPGANRDGDWLVGYGCAAATFPCFNYGGSATVTLLRSGRARVETAASEIGTGAYTALGQVAAELLDLPIENVEVLLGDSLLPPTAPAGGSMQTASTVPAIRLACERIVSRLGNRMPALADLGAAFDRLGTLSIQETAQYAAFDGKNANGGRAVLSTPDGDEPIAIASYGAQFVEVRINARTKELRVPRLVGAFAAGRILNERMALAQYRGGMVWGLSSALFEGLAIDPIQSRVTNTNFEEYAIPVNADVQMVEAILVPEEDHEVNPLGVKGIGEIGIVGVAAAVSNAIFHATGKRLRDLPITLDKLF
ncbi:xanthine dehydrogenase family protein molybdopterin-binding subunit [Shinella sp. CPCC 101442]|uniref:xanthine dehydrogenase family protein molybdopterin-binding subunit n=1 Tax=Shinella sp. CPCC 101442 TaxID=2932265 RepID=UPI0021530D59|nr:xanthine dehydrogenase family protein molybdopterin-binding subunit [Shinella sp. CPCC 101442]MCR6502929.1 xanthine dehydrogenase family protein molybdopterin-binding subunit [Shinella sp. CPCC 101442]